MKAMTGVAALGTALLLTACAVSPPPMMAVPGKNKDVAAFQADETACRQAASQAAYPPAAAGAKPPAAAAAWQMYDDAYGRCMTAHGDTVQPVPYAAYAGYYPYYYDGFADPFFFPGYYDGFYGGIGLVSFGYGYGFGHYGYPGHWGGGSHGFGPGGFAGFTHGASAGRR
jgi:hypothetical protein